MIATPLRTNPIFSFPLGEFEVTEAVARSFREDELPAFRASDLPLCDERKMERNLALITASYAAEENADSSLVVASLLHNFSDYAWIEKTKTNSNRLDRFLESGIYDWMLSCFGESVAEPIRLQTPAFRFLCTSIPSFLQSRSTQVQGIFFREGGPMSDAEAESFRKNRFCHRALKIRGWRDRADRIGRTPPPVDWFETHLRATIAKNRGRG